MSVLKTPSRMITLNAHRTFNSNSQNTSKTMKTIIAPLILLAAIALPLHAAPPIPATSSVELKLSSTVKIGDKPTPQEIKEDENHHICYGDTTIYSLEPVFTRGLDATSSNLVISIYIIGSGDVYPSDKKSELSISKPISQLIPNDSKISLVKNSSYTSLKWRCGGECSRRKSRPAPDWYAEVIQDGKVLCSTQSKSSSAIKKLIETRKIISEAEVKALPIPGKSSGTH